jgi:mRNA interferase YafQ
MRPIEVSSQFEMDVKKNYLSLLTPAWGEVLNCLINDVPPPAKYKDHALTCNHKRFRDCHIKSGLVLIYRVQSDTVDFVRLGSHSEVFN